MFSNGLWKCLAGMLLVLVEAPHPLTQSDWPQVQQYVNARLALDPMAQALQNGDSEAYAYTYSRPSNARFHAFQGFPAGLMNGFSSRSGLSEAEHQVAENERESDAIEESRGRSADAQPRFIGKFKEWYKEKEEEEEDDNRHVIISTHHVASSHDSAHHQMDHGYGPGSGYVDHGRGHADIHLHGYPPYPHHSPPPPVYHYPHQGQPPVIQPIIIEQGRGHGNSGGGKKKKKKEKETTSFKGVHTETVIITQPRPTVVTQTIYHQKPQQTIYTTHSQGYSPTYATPSQVIIHTSSGHGTSSGSQYSTSSTNSYATPSYATPSHVYIQQPTPSYATPSHVYIQQPHTEYLPSHVYITQTHTVYAPSPVYNPQPHTEYVAVSVESDDHGWGWGWDMLNKGKGHGGGRDKGKGQVVYMVDSQHSPQYVTPQLTTTHVVMQQQVQIATDISQPSMSEVMIMEAPSQSFKKGFQKVKDTFKAFGDGIKGVGEGIKDTIKEGVDSIKSKLSFEGEDDEVIQYVMVEQPHSVVMVQPDITKTVVVQKPVTQTIVQKPVIQTIMQKPVIQTIVQKPNIQTVTAYHPSGGYQVKGSSKSGGIYKGLFKSGHSFGKGSSKGNERIVIVSGGGGGGGYGHHHHPPPHRPSGCTHCG